MGASAANDRIPFTMDNLLLDANDANRWLRNCALKQIGASPWSLQSLGSRYNSIQVDPLKVQDIAIVHRNLNVLEQTTDSNERELIAALHLLYSCWEQIHDSSLNIYFDNFNASQICSQGSNKPRLQHYAV